MAVPLTVLAVDIRHAAQQLFLSESLAAVRLDEGFPVGPHEHPHLGGSQPAVLAFQFHVSARCDSGMCKLIFAQTFGNPVLIIPYGPTSGKPRL